MLHRTSPKHEFAPSHFIATSIRSPYHSGTTTPSRFRWVEMKHILWSSSDILHQPMEDVMTAVSLVLLRFVCCFLFSCTFCALLLSSYLRLQPLRASSCRLARAVLRLCSLTSALSSVFFVWFVWWNGGNVVTDILSGLFASRSIPNLLWHFLPHLFNCRVRRQNYQIIISTNKALKLNPYIQTMWWTGDATTMKHKWA